MAAVAEDCWWWAATRRRRSGGSLTCNGKRKIK
jgi:hypothetical protein